MKATVNPVALKAMVSAALCAYMMLLVAPEPVTKLVAIALAAYLVAYVGMGPLWNMVEGFRRLRDESEKATSFAALEEIGHRFGRVMGENGARVAILVVLAAAGGRAGLAKNGPTLPGYAQAAMAAETQAGFQLAAVAAGEIQSISISAGALTVGLAPTAVAAVAWGPEEGGPRAQRPSISYPGKDPTKAPGPGFSWKGKPPVGGEQGAWYNPETGESWHPDLGHAEPIGPHWDYIGPDKSQWRVFPDGRIEPKR